MALDAAARLGHVGGRVAHIQHAGIELQHRYASMFAVSDGHLKVFAPCQCALGQVDWEGKCIKEAVRVGDTAQVVAVVQSSMDDHIQVRVIIRHMQHNGNVVGSWRVVLTCVCPGRSAARGNL